MLGISLYSYLYIKIAKTLCVSYYRYVFLIIAYVFSSTKLDKRAELILPGSEGVEGRRRGQEMGGRDGPNNVCR
jgi:hypothetical protein